MLRVSTALQTSHFDLIGASLLMSTQQHVALGTAGAQWQRAVETTEGQKSGRDKELSANEHTERDRSGGRTKHMVTNEKRKNSRRGGQKPQTWKRQAWRVISFNLDYYNLKRF